MTLSGLRFDEEYLFLLLMVLYTEGCVTVEAS